MLNDEDDHLISARDRLTDLGLVHERIEREIVDQPSTTLSFPQVYEAWQRLQELEAECDRLLAERQQVIHDTGTFGKFDATDFYGYLYEDLDITYPILTEGMRLLEQVRVAQRQLGRELTRHA